MKNLMLICLFCFGCQAVLHAQGSIFPNKLNQNTKVKNYQDIDQKPLHFGFCLGINTLDWNVTYNAQSFVGDSLFPDVVKLIPGFHVNVVTEFRLNDHFAFRFLPGIVFTQRTITFWNQNNEIDREFQLESNMLDFPMLLKYKAKRIDNYRPYMVGGANVRWDMAAKKSYDDDEEVFMRIKKLDYFYEVGFGIDFYLTYFKFTTEIKWSEGIRNMLVDDPHPRYPKYVNAIDKMNSKAFIISFYFE